jgi:hypothetical protein
MCWWSMAAMSVIFDPVPAFDPGLAPVAPADRGHFFPPVPLLGLGLDAGAVTLRREFIRIRAR